MKSIKLILPLLVIFLLIVNCQIKKNQINKNLSKLILSNHDLRGKLIKAFELTEDQSMIFKVLVSRRNEFVRISIFRIVNKNDLNDLPSSYFTFKASTFLCYDGSEVISNNILDNNFFNKLTSNLKSNSLYNSPVLQFDIDGKKNIVLHNPAINPYDMTERKRNQFP